MASGSSRPATERPAIRSYFQAAPNIPTQMLMNKTKLMTNTGRLRSHEEISAARQHSSKASARTVAKARFTIMSP